jgi:hypothetical protein
MHKTHEFQYSKFKLCQMLWHTSAIPTFGRLRQEDYEFKASLGYIAISRPAWATE